ncbi:MAG: hypothetical protein HUK15_08480, partial [Bacteroidales bacterium]|nr:hypothetical protein [Bacteroidales bacterium]
MKINKKIGDIKMKLECPNCHQLFDVDGAQYAALLNQVKNHEFDAEVERRMEEVRKQLLAEQETESVKAQRAFDKELQKKDKAISDKESLIASLKEQVKSVGKEMKLEMSVTIAEKEKEISRLIEQLKGQESEKQHAVREALVDKDAEIQRLQSVIEQNETDKKLAVMEEQKKAEQIVHKKDEQIIALKGQLDTAKNEATINANNLKEQFRFKEQQLQEQVDYYKDLKT